MTTQINPYLSFNGKCREAMTFYKECLGGELTLLSVEDSPMATQWPAAVQKHILNGMLVNNDIVLLASDMQADGGGEKVVGNTISLSLNCGTIEELNTYFNKLSKGGTIIRQPHAFFAGTIAVLADKFGLSWMFFHAKKQD
jgi:PhnB protein